MLYDPRWEKKTDLASPVAATLLRAADILETRGWCQRAGQIEGAVCPHVALLMVADSVTAAAAYNYLDSYLWKNFSVAGVERWNDTPGRTKSEVLAAMRSAAIVPSEETT